MNKDIQAYNNSQTKNDKAICDLLLHEVCKALKNVESKIWHGHPVWFINGNPIVGYSKLKNCIQLLFWSGQSFDEEALQKLGSFKAAEMRYTTIEQIDIKILKRWLKKSQEIQWNYKDLIKLKKLEPLQGIAQKNSSIQKSPIGPRKFKTITEYHAAVPVKIRKTLNQLRNTIQHIAPQAKESISYNMPAFKMNSVLVYYAINKEHIGFYPTPSPIKFFQTDLMKYKTSKGAIQFPLNKPLPIALIKKIVQFRIDEDHQKSKPKIKGKK